MSVSPDMLNRIWDNQTRYSENADVIYMYDTRELGPITKVEDEKPNEIYREIKRYIFKNNDTYMICYKVDPAQKDEIFKDKVLLVIDGMPVKDKVTNFNKRFDFHEKIFTIKGSKIPYKQIYTDKRMKEYMDATEERIIKYISRGSNDSDNLEEDQRQIKFPEYTLIQPGDDDYFNPGKPGDYGYFKPSKPGGSRIRKTKRRKNKNKRKTRR
jgi:hypothetical protein